MFSNITMEQDAQKLPISCRSEELTQQNNSQCKALLMCTQIQKALGISYPQQKTGDPQVLAEIIVTGNFHYLLGSFATWKTVR